MSRLRRGISWLTVSREAGWRFALPCALLFLAYLIWGHAYHEPWRDEIHPWVIARQADGFWDIATGDRVYDGHPPAWFWYLRVWTWFTRGLWGLHAANIAAIGCAGLLFLRYAPFPRILRVALLSSYLIGYEYGIVSRNYSLGILLIFGFCSLYHPSRRRVLALSAMLALLALTSVYGVILACALFLFVIANSSALHCPTPRPEYLSLRFDARLMVGACVVAGGVALAYLTTSPPDPNPFAPAWNFDALNLTGLELTGKRLVISFLPVRSFDDFQYWWNSDYFWRDHETLFAYAALAFPLLLLVALVPRWTELGVFLCGASLMAVLELARYSSGVRHWGHHFLLFLAVSWLGRSRKPRSNSWAMMLALTLASAFQVPSLLVAAHRDRVQAFAGGGEIAERIEREGLQRLPIVGGPAGGVLSVTGRLDLPFISSETEEISETVVFHGRRTAFAPSLLLSKAIAVSRQRHSPVLVVSMVPLDVPVPRGWVLDFLFTNQRPALEENFFVYTVHAI